MIGTRTVGIVGVGHVGAHVANALVTRGLVDEVRLVDLNLAKVRSERQDLTDSLPFCPHDVAIKDCGDRYEELAGCDIVVNAAGNVSLARESRDGELSFSTEACRSFAERLVGAGFDGILLSIANPCDVVATTFWKLTGYDPRRVIGSGTGLDSARLRMELSRLTGVAPCSIDAYMLGEHGFSGLAALSCASFAGKPLAELEREDPERFRLDAAAVEEAGLKNGYVTISGKGCTEYAVAGAAARLVAAVFNDAHAVIAASTLMTGEYGVEGVFASLPCVIGAGGVERVITLSLSAAEEEKFRASCAHIRENLERVDWIDL